MQRPMMIIFEVLIEEERTMSGLLPVARSARPRFVLRKNEKYGGRRTNELVLTGKRRAFKCGFYLCKNRLGEVEINERRVAHYGNVD